MTPAISRAEVEEAAHRWLDEMVRRSPGVYHQLNAYGDIPALVELLIGWMRRQGVRVE